MEYADVITQVALSCSVPADNEDFSAAITGAIAYAEDRIYRDPMFDFLVQHGRATASALTIGSRNVALPSSILIAEACNVVLPSGASPDAANSKRVPLQRQTMAYLDLVWGNMATTGVPQHYAPIDDRNWRLGPVPDAAYLTEWLGTLRPTPLSASNRATFLTENMFSLFVAGMMVYMTGTVLKNFGAQADAPEQAQSWENQFQQLKLGPQVEEARRKSESAGWTPRAPTIAATPPRG